MSRPNVLILMCDQMQARRMGFVDGIAHTPVLDALAEEGVHFRQRLVPFTANVRAVAMRVVDRHVAARMQRDGQHGFFDHCGHLTAKNRTFVHELSGCRLHDRALRQEPPRFAA
jgi:hypothetical protein